MSTPYLDEAERCARVTLIHGGRALATDEPKRLRAAMPGRMVEVWGRLVSGHVDLIRRLPGVDDAQVFGERLHVTLGGEGEDAIERFRAALQATALAEASVRPVPPSLEDVFIARLAQEMRS
jgi:ABC-2 type transport system ATP-binding protein